MVFNVTFSDISAIECWDNCPVSKFRPAVRHPKPWAARGLKRAETTPTRVPGRPYMSLTILPSEDPHAQSHNLGPFRQAGINLFLCTERPEETDCLHAVRLWRESNTDLLIRSPARYLIDATAAGSLQLAHCIAETKLRSDIGFSYWPNWSVQSRFHHWSLIHWAPSLFNQ